MLKRQHVHPQEPTDKQPDRDRSQALDVAIVRYTRFPNQSAQSKERFAVTLPRLAEIIRTTTAASKAALPWLKLARFGEKRTIRNCLRHDINTLSIDGCEGDYDRGEMSIETAADLLRQAKVRAMLYTSASHTPEKPRWRVVAPSSMPLPPERRRQLMARVNGILNGVLASESFVLSQAYYFGHVGDNPIEVIVIDGDFIDQRPDLDGIAIGKSKNEKSESKSKSKVDDDDGVDPFLKFASDQMPGAVNINARLKAMQYKATDDTAIHITQRSVTAAMLERDYAIEETVARVLIATVVAAGKEAGKWDWKKEEQTIYDLCDDWLKKHPRPAAFTIDPGIDPGIDPDIDTQETDPVTERAWPVMGDDARHGLAGDVVRLFEGQTEGDPNAILLQFLTYFGNMVGRDHFYQVEGDRHRANLFTVIVGDTSSGRKGVSANRVRQLMETVDRINNGKWFECIKSGLSSGEGLIYEIRDDATTTDAQGTTVTGMARDKRRLIDEREFSRVLSVMKRDGNTLSAVIRDAWDSRPLSIMVKNNPARCREPHLSISAHITPDELRRDLDSISMANGYANRFLYGCARRPIKLALGGTTDLDALNKLAEKISVQFFKCYQVEKVLTLDAQARELWISVYDELSDSKPGLVGAIIGRGEAQTMRIALIYALLDGSDQIQLPHLKAALAVWKYCEDSVRYIFGDSVGDLVADKILRALRTGSKTRTELFKMFGHNMKSERIETALETLRRFGLAREGVTTASGKRGRPMEVWHAV